MNIVLVYSDGTLVTPASDSILEGVTRDSVLQLARDRGHRVEERPVSIDEWRAGVASGDIAEVFACGTAAVITPIAQLRSEEFTIGEADAPAGELTMSLRDELTDIQYGRRPDRHGWLTRLDA
jgi:branched-chain amino acid aminotransferase